MENSTNHKYVSWQSTSILWNASCSNVQSSTFLFYDSGPKVIALGLGFQGKENAYSLSNRRCAGSWMWVRGFCGACWEHLLCDRQSSAVIGQSVCQDMKAFENTLSVFSNS